MWDMWVTASTYYSPLGRRVPVRVINWPSGRPSRGNYLSLMCLSATKLERRERDDASVVWAKADDFFTSKPVYQKKYFTSTNW